MPYVVQGINNEIRAAMGEFTPAPAYDFVFETVMPSMYVSEQMGMTVESATAAPRVHAGEFITTVKGDFVRVEYTSVDSSGNVVISEAVQVDVGAGAEQLQTVEYDDAPPPDATPVSESVISVDPNLNTTVETEIAPEAPQAEVTGYTVGASAPVVADGYSYTSSGDASATTDLIAYGELDVNGNPIAVTDPTYGGEQYPT